MAEMAAEREEDFNGKVEKEDFVEWWVEKVEEMHTDLKEYQLKRTESDFDDDEGLFGDDDDSTIGRRGEKDRILSKYLLRSMPQRTSSKREYEYYKFTFRVENNPKLFSTTGNVCTVRAKDMSHLTKALKSDLGISHRTDIEIWYYDDEPQEQKYRQAEGLKDLYYASKGVCPRGGHKLSVHVVDSRFGFRRCDTSSSNVPHSAR